MGNYYAGMMNNTGGYGELKHHGILGQKWGVRRWQNADGSLTAAGRERYGTHRHTNERYVFRNLLRKAYDDPENRERFNNFLNSNNKDAKEMLDAAESCSKVSTKLNEAFFKYSEKLEKERGEEWGGDGTEEHWELEKRYPEYLKISKQFENAQKNFIEVVQQKADSGVLDDVLNATDYRYRYVTGDRKEIGEDTINGRAALASDFISDRYLNSTGRLDVSAEDFERLDFKDRKTIRERLSNFNKGITNGEKDSTKVKELTLRRQMERNISDGIIPSLPSDPRNPATKEERKLTDKFIKTSIKTINKSSMADPEVRKKAKADANAYMREVAKLRLKSMGYDVTNKAINNLLSKQWFKDSLLIRNSLTTMGGDGMRYTSGDDYRS